LSAAIEQPARQPGLWMIQVGMIRDQPRFSWRGAMFDVPKKFFDGVGIKALISRKEYCGMNRFRLRLTGKQGWRIEVKSWPDLRATGS
jgi:hexosaminidase